MLKLYNRVEIFVESFESFVDLFTILSFTLIVAAYLFGSYQYMDKRDLKDDKATTIEFYEIVKTGNVNSVLPSDAVIIFIAKEGQSDVVRFTKSGKSAETYYTIDKNTFSVIFESELKDYRGSDNIYLVAIQRFGNINYELFYLFQNWLQKNGYEKVKAIFE
jgi:hypothetical protein